MLKNRLIKNLGSLAKKKQKNISNQKEVLDKKIQCMHIVLEIFFIFVKNDHKVKGLNIFKHEFLYTSYADDFAFFLKDRKSIIESI